MINNQDDFLFKVLAYCGAMASFVTSHDNILISLRDVIVGAVALKILITIFSMSKNIYLFILSIIGIYVLTPAIAGVYADNVTRLLLCFLALYALVLFGERGKIKSFKDYTLLHQRIIAFLHSTF